MMKKKVLKLVAVMVLGMLTVVQDKGKEHPFGYATLRSG